jgi:hypothetical protein
MMSIGSFLLILTLLEVKKDSNFREIIGDAGCRLVLVLSVRAKYNIPKKAVLSCIICMQVKLSSRRTGFKASEDATKIMKSKLINKLLKKMNGPLT